MTNPSVSRLVAAAVLLFLACGAAFDLAVSVADEAPRRAAVIGKSSGSSHVRIAAPGTPASSLAEHAPSRRLAAGRRVLSRRDGGVPRQRLAELTTLRI